MNFGRNVVSWMAITATVTIGLCATMGTQGCTVTTGVPDDDGGFDFDTSTPTNDGGADTSTPDTSVPVNACNECLFGHCAGQYAVCVQNADCRAIYACATAPGCDSNCVQSCYDNGTPAGKQMYLAYASCDLAWSCADCSVACNTDPSACTPPADAGPDTSAPDTSTPVDAAPPATCDQCIADNCSAEKSTCAAGSDCDTYTACLGACADAACAAACTTNHQAGATAAAALANCTSTNCKTPCGY